METFLVLIIAGVVMFAASLLLFRISPKRRAVPSIWKQGGVAARLALLAWWAALAFLGSGLLMAIRA